MNTGIDIGLLRSRLKTFEPNEFGTPRLLSLYSAAIAAVDRDSMSMAIKLGKGHNVDRSMFYEIVLQSYLFLGFPRMLIAAETLDQVLPNHKAVPETRQIDNDESKTWFEDGLKLYQRVYDSSSAPLRDKVEAIAPEVFRWMIIEGYGKVLSRPGLGIVSRELSIVAFLMMENRDIQLHSHARGAINVGASPELLRFVARDIGRAAGDGYESMLEILKTLGYGL